MWCGLGDTLFWVLGGFGWVGWLGLGTVWFEFVLLLVLYLFLFVGWVGECWLFWCLGGFLVLFVFCVLVVGCFIC